MTIPVLKMRILPKPLVKGKMDVRFPAAISGSAFITSTKTNGNIVIAPDYTLLDQTPFLDPANTIVAVWDKASQSWKQTTLSALISGTTGIVQDVTAAGPIDILPNAGIVRLFASIGGPVTLNMPLASVKTCPVLISDWTLGCGTNSAAINVSGADKLPGNLTTWTIAGDAGSVFLRPVSGGYVL